MSNAEIPSLDDLSVSHFGVENPLIPIDPLKAGLETSPSRLTPTLILQVDSVGNLYPPEIPPTQVLDSDSLTGNEILVGGTSEDPLINANEVNLPDLVAKDLQAPPTARSDSHIPAVSWTVLNQGTGTTTADNWLDSFYLSTDRTFDPNNDTFPLVGYYRQKILAANESYTQNNVHVHKNDVVPGEYYLFVATDSWPYGDYNNVQAESNETNNVSSPVPITIIPSSNADLVISDATVSGDPTPGNYISLSWTVTNQGTEATEVNWSDYVYLSRDQVSDYQDQYFTGTYITNDLAPNESYTIDLSVYLPADLDTSEDYYLVFGSDGNNDQSESDNDNNNLAIPLITGERSDLIVTSVTAPNTAGIGSSIDVSWTVKNQGTGVADGAEGGVNYWVDSVHLSNDSILDGSDQLLTVYYINSELPLAANQVYSINNSVDLPSELFGEYYLIIKADFSEYEAETNENNNTFARPITINAPDLIVSSTSPPLVANLGSTINVFWTVKNQGNGIAYADWYDYVYLSRDTVIDSLDTRIAEQYISAQTPLAADGTYIINKSIFLPNSSIAGDVNLIFSTDHFNSQIETDNTNNVLVAPINISGPDLTVSAATAPNSAILSSNINVFWTVTNQGNLPANAGWYDRIYVSNDAIFDSSDVYVSDQYKYPPLAVNSTSKLDRFITLPANAGTGDKYLLFIADYARYQGETNENNNVKAIPIKLSAPDLSITTATATATAPNKAILSQPINVSWIVKNQGNVVAPANWYDEIYVSNDDKWDSSDLQVGNGSDFIDSQTPLAADGTYSFNKTITIPANAAIGNRYLIFYTDSGNRQGETNENNNTFVIPITLEAPDLIVTEATAPEVGIVGGQIEVTWKVTNQGTVEAPADWSDRVYLSTDQYLNSYYYYDDLPLLTESITSQTPLAPNSSYPVTRTFTLPSVGNGNNNLPENSYLIFVADQGNAQGETNENNNIKVVPIKLKKPDLTIIEATAPPPGLFHSKW